MLTCISGVDYPNNTYRFQVVYELLEKLLEIKLASSKKNLH